MSTPFLAVFRQVFMTQLAHLSMPLPEVESRISELKAERFTYLNQTLSLSLPDWNERYVSHLWNYQLHYQDYVIWAARSRVERHDEIAWSRARGLIESWLSQARIGVSDGWDAYPTSLRLVHWLYAYALISEHESDAEFLRQWRAGIYRQLDFLYWHLEKHLLANHLFKNIKALVVGGLFFAGEPRGQRWLRTGERLLLQELAEQVLPDGGHYERAPMYHAQTLGDALECYALLKAAGHASADETMRQQLGRMADFLAAMSYPDGTLALFNDSANTFETQPRPLLESARQVCGERADKLLLSFPDSGYYGWQSPDGREKIIVDAGEPSVSYNTAHAHCDLLSYELWLNGAPFIVDAGVHGYGGNEFREYCRSTRAHNTVMINQAEQSEIWGTFRMARRAELLFAGAEGDGDEWRFEGAYRCYSDRGARHQRQVIRYRDKSWEIRDKITVRNKQTAHFSINSFIHLHPTVKASKAVGGIVCQTTAGEVLIEPYGFAGYELESAVPPPQAQGWHFPDFGVAYPSVTVTLWQTLNNYDEVGGFGYRIKPC